MQCRTEHWNTRLVVMVCASIHDRPQGGGELPGYGGVVMIQALQTLVSRVRSDEGATALEYGVLVAFIAVIIIGGVTIFGEALNQFFAGLWPNI